MRSIWIIPVLAVLILGSLGLIQEARAIDYVVSNEAECLAFPGFTTFGFQNLETCFLTSDFTLNAGDALTVENIEFQASSTITNFGTIELIGGDSFGKGRIDLRGGGHLINECGGIVNANGGTGSQSGELALAGTSIITNFDTINLLGGNGPASGSILFGQPGGIVNNHGTINENPGAGPISGSIGLSFSGLNDNLVPKCGPEITVDTTGDQSIGSGESLVIKNGATVTGNVSVDGGILFIIEGAAVDGKITGTNSEIRIDNCAVSGTIKATNSEVEIDNCTIGGHVKTDGGTLSITNDSTVNGNVNAKNSDSVTITDNNNSFNQNIIVENAVSADISNNNVAQNLRVTTSGTVTITDNTVGGDLHSFDNVETTITGNTVTGNLNTRGTDDVTTSNNSVGANLKASESNSVQIIGNTVGEKLVVKDNSNVIIDNNNPIGLSLRVLENSQTTISNNHANNKIIIKDNTLCIQSGNTADGKIKITGCDETSGTIVTIFFHDANVPIPDAQCTAQSFGAFSVSDTTNVNGIFSFVVPDGITSFFANCTPDGVTFGTFCSVSMFFINNNPSVLPLDMQLGTSSFCGGGI